MNIKSLIAKLNFTTRQALDAGAGLCLSRTNYNVEIEHWVFKLVEAPRTDLTSLFRFYGVNVTRLLSDLTKAIDRFQTGNSRSPSLSPHIMELAREGWLTASVEFGVGQVRSSHLLYALLTHESLARWAHATSEQFKHISPESLKKELADLIAGSPEDEPAAGSAEAAAGATAPDSAGGTSGKTPALDRFTIDLTRKASQGKIDPVLGRDAEIRQVIDILLRRRQNNPILTGEAGVGKTAVVEGLAQRIVAGDVPHPLRNIQLRALDLGLLQAGASMRGEFESRLKSVIDEVTSSPTPIVLFIDEAHTMIGAGGQPGQADAANLLKPALARGELRTIAATTWAEYKKYFERDAALARRFQVVKVEEPSDETTIEMLRALVHTLEAHHRVHILEEALVDAVRLSRRFIAFRHLPDKAVALLDTACARVALGQSATPPAIEDCRRRIDQLHLAIEILQREHAAGEDHAERIAASREAIADAEQRLAALEARWRDEAKLVNEITRLRSLLAGANQLSTDEREKLRTELKRLNASLKDCAGESPLMQVCVDSQAVAQVVSGWTGIPTGRMFTNELQTILDLKTQLSQRIVGQDHAVAEIAMRIRTARANLTDPRRPIGVFLLVGSSGVGKTEMAITLADLLYGGEQNMTVINMSEFKEEHKVSLLMGSPPGYVGYGEGGVLTEAVRRRPYSVVLLDEMEKAHPGVQDVFYQVFDKGTLRDGEGRDIDFRNTVVLMTSNAGTDTIIRLCADRDTLPDPAALATALIPDLQRVFKPAFLGRVTVVPFFPLSDDVMRRIAELQLARVAKRVHEHYRAELHCHPELVNSIVHRCKEVQTGARNIDHILTRTLLPELAAEFLTRMGNRQSVSRVDVSVGPAGEFIYEVT